MNFVMHEHSFCFPIVVQPCDPSKLQRPLHGRLICTENQNSHTCVTSCDPQHVLNHVTDYHSIQCENNGRWARQFPRDYRAKACLSEYRHQVINDILFF